jgi:hypothetical protein
MWAFVGVRTLLADMGMIGSTVPRLVVLDASIV